MKALLLYIICLSLVLILLPAILAGGILYWERGREEKRPYYGEIKEREDAFGLKVYLHTRDESVEMELEEYVTGVIAAEMPASFHLEALKAQAVVARTYALHKAALSGGSGCQSHPGFDLCTDSTCCQAWEDEQSTLKKWPPQEAAHYLERIRTAVSSTRGLVMTYRGSPITAVYHSTCGGRTETAVEVWNGGSAPYLQSVPCSFCGHSPYYRGETVMDLSTYAAALKDQKEALPVLAEGNIPLIKVMQRSGSGRNLVLNIGRPEREYSGTEVRLLLGLPSTYFQWRVEGEKIIFSTRGYGHGVGMCQYGADGMAREGNDFIEILRHYYRGVEIEPPVYIQ